MLSAKAEELQFQLSDNSVTVAVTVMMAMGRRILRTIHCRRPPSRPPRVRDDVVKTGEELTLTGKPTELIELSSSRIGRFTRCKYVNRHQINRTNSGAFRCSQTTWKFSSDTRTHHPESRWKSAKRPRGRHDHRFWTESTRSEVNNRLWRSVMCSAGSATARS